MKIELRRDKFGDGATLLHEVVLPDQLVVDFVMRADSLTLPGQERFSVKSREVVVEDGSNPPRASVVKLYGNFIGS